MNPAELAGVVAQADKITVYEGVVMVASDGSRAGEPVLYSSASPQDLRELAKAVAVTQPGSWFLCACIPPVEIALSRKNKKLGVIEINEDLSIGFSKWSGDARLKNEEKLLEWFDHRGIKQPRQNLERLHAQDVAERVASARWLAAMPPDLRPLWPGILKNPLWWQMPPDAPKASAKILDPVLAKEYPDLDQRIRSLFSWFGSGSGHWSGYYAWEDVPSRMLLEYSGQQLANALQAAPLTDAQAEGAVRFFVVYTPDALFRPPEDMTLIAQLPEELKKTLLEHVATSGDQEKLEIARKAFQMP